MPHRHGSALLAVLAALLLLTMGAASATAAVQQPTGGPILVVTSSADPFGSYETEILRNEGFNDFAVVDVSGMAAQLDGHDTVVLAPTALTDAQVDALTTWVQGGGNLIAMRPDKKLAPLLGLADADDTLSNGNLRIDTSQAPGKGLTSSPLQFHGAADLYTLNGASSVATLMPDTNPAVSLRTVGAGHAAAFTYDLARSVVYTRQGNPSWVGQNRDQFAFGPNPDAITRANDLFFGGMPGDLQPDWVDLNRVAIPQADEQQRLLGNMIVQLSVTPTPRFWYLPRGDKAAIALTGDDHGSGGTSSVFDSLYTLGGEIDPRCKDLPTDQALLDSWTCPRGTTYFWPDAQDVPPISSQEAENWSRYGFEFSDHPLLQPDASCVGFTWQPLNQTLDNELAIFHQKYPTVPGPTTTRTHCIAWSDWSSQPKADLAHGIRLNTDYYYFPAEWTQNRAGLFTASGMPMRFADCDGSLIDVYHAATYVADDATTVQGAVSNANTVVPDEVQALIDNALGTTGYYGAFTVQVHTDEWNNAPARDALVAYAVAHGVPVISEAQLLRWIDGRNASSFRKIKYETDGTLRFTVDQAPGADGLQAMIPAKGLGAVTRDGDPLNYDKQTIKGIDYAILPDASGDYVASYSTHPATPHIASSVTDSIPGGNGGSGGCEDAGDPGANPPGGDNGGGNNGGGGNGGGNNGGSGTTTTPTVITEAGHVAAASTKTTKVLPFLTATALRFRPGSRRAFVLTVRLRRTSRLVVTFRSKDGKVVRTIRVPRRKAGTTVLVPWDGKDRRGHYVSAGSYRYAVTAIGNGHLRTARGSVAVLTAR